MRSQQNTSPRYPYRCEHFSKR